MYYVNTSSCEAINISDNVDIANFYNDRFQTPPRIKGRFNNCQVFDFYLPRFYNLDAEADMTTPCAPQTTIDGYVRNKITVTLTGMSGAITSTTAAIQSNSSLFYPTTITKISDSVFVINYLGQGEIANVLFTVTDIYGYDHKLNVVVYVDQKSEGYDCDEIKISSFTSLCKPSYPCGVIPGQGNLLLFGNLFGSDCECPDPTCTINTEYFRDAVDGNIVTTSIDYTYIVNDDIRYNVSVPFNPYTDFTNQTVTISNANLGTGTPLSSTINWIQNTYDYVFQIAGINPTAATTTETVYIYVENNNTLNGDYYYNQTFTQDINVSGVLADWNFDGSVVSGSAAPPSTVPINMVSCCEQVAPVENACALNSGVYTIDVNSDQRCLFIDCNQSIFCFVSNNFIECANNKPIILYNTLLSYSNNLPGCSFNCTDINLMYENLYNSLIEDCNVSSSSCTPILSIKPSDCGCNK